MKPRPQQKLELSSPLFKTKFRRAAKELLKEIRLFDVYRGPGVAEGKKSAAFSLVLRSDERSLTAEEADACIADVLSALFKELQAVLR